MTKTEKANTIKIKVNWDTVVDHRLLTLSEAGLPETVLVPKEIVVEDQANQFADTLVADWLSDNYGFCVYGWNEVPAD
jgi:hypothetical protein